MALKEVGVKLVVDGINDFKRKLGDAGGSIDSMGSKLKKAAPAIRNIGLAMTGVAAGIGIGSIKMAADFESAMREVNTLIGLSKEEFEALSDSVLETAKAVGKSPEEMASALYQIVSAGIPAGEAMEFLATSAKAAIGGVTDTTTAVDGITTVINAFHMSASDAESVASTMFETVKRGKTTFEELSSYMFQVASQAAALEIPFATVSSALASMTKQGIPTAQATTQLRQAMVALSKPTEDMKKALKALGYESGRALIKDKGLAKALNLLRGEAQGSDEILGKMFGSVEAIGAVFALTGENANIFTEDLEAITQASEDATAATEAYNEMNESTARKFEMLMTNVKVLAIQIGEALIPALLSIFEAIKPVLEKITQWISDNPKLTAAIVAVVGTLGVLLTTLGLVAPAIGAITTALGIILSPIGLVVAAIVALVAAWVILYNKWDKIPGWIKIIMAGLMPFVTLPVLIIKNWETIKGFFSKMWNGIQWVFKSGANAVIGIMNTMFGFFSGKKIFSISIPSWVPGIGGKGFTLTLPKIPKIPTLAQGGEVLGGGSAIVGERGPELLNLPPGAVVRPLTNNYEYNITENYARPESPQSLDLSLRALAMYART